MAPLLRVCRRRRRGARSAATRFRPNSASVDNLFIWKLSQYHKILIKLGIRVWPLTPIFSSVHVGEYWAYFCKNKVTIIMMMMMGLKYIRSRTSVPLPCVVVVRSVRRCCVWAETAAGFNPQRRRGMAGERRRWALRRAAAISPERTLSIHSGVPQCYICSCLQSRICSLKSHEWLFSHIFGTPSSFGTNYRKVGRARKGGVLDDPKVLALRIFTGKRNMGVSQTKPYFCRRCIVLLQLKWDQILSIGFCSSFRLRQRHENTIWPNLRIHFGKASSSSLLLNSMTSRLFFVRLRCWCDGFYFTIAVYNSNCS